MTVTESSPVAEWFSLERGIAPETLTEFGIKERSDGAVVFPYSNGEKVRKGIPSGERQMFFTAGKKPNLFHDEDISGKSQVFMVEGETDTMRLWQEVQGTGVGVVGLPGIETWRDEMAEAFADVDRVYVVLDNDADYNVVARVDNAWKNIRAALGKRAQRVRLPRDVKDVCEFFNVYDIDTLRLLVQHKQPGESRYKALDLTQEPPPVKWLIEDLICAGDINLLLGEPGIGKSWLSMSLALSIAAGRTAWCDRKVFEQGRVLYLDEENPHDLVFDRFRKLGMTRENAQNIRYLNNLGIRLDRGADELIDEALDFEPTLIVLDSLTRFHTGDEDKAGMMAALYNDGLKPLARETGAAVILLHHANKSDSNSSYRRARGSGEITANADAVFDVRQVALNTLTIANSKSRRKQMGDVMTVEIQDTPEGGVQVVGGTAVHPLF